MATMVMISSHNGKGIGTVHDDSNESDGIYVAVPTRRAMSDCLHEVSVSSSPVSSSSRNRSQGFPLCNSKTQLLRVNALYEDNEEQDLNHSRDYSRDYSDLNRSRDYSELDKSREEADFYLNLCMSREEGNVSSPLYQASSSSSTASSSCIESDENDNDFLIEARASLMALQEWQHLTTIDDDDGDNDDDDVSNCDASCNSSYDGNLDVNKSFDAHSACGYDEFNGINGYVNPTPRSCPDLSIRKRSQPHRHVSAKSWLQEMKDDDFQQRQRIADAIAASSKGNADTAPTMRTRIGSKSILKNRAKMFRNKENLESDHKNDVSKQKQGKERLKTGRQKLMNSLLLNRPWQNQSAFSRKQRRKSCENRDDNNISISDIVAAMETESPVGKKVDYSPAPTNDKESELKRAFFGNARASPGEKKFGSSPSPTNDKDLQLKRALFGNARVVTMDGIVESFADNTTTSGPDEQEPFRGSTIFAPTSDAPLSWV
jgi:hypothetical protein